MQKLWLTLIVILATLGMTFTTSGTSNVTPKSLGNPVSKLRKIKYHQTAKYPVYVKSGSLAKQYPKQTWYVSAKTADNVLYKVTNESGSLTKIVPKVNLGSINSKKYDVKFTDAPRIKNTKLMCLGDSITKGFNGYYVYKRGNFPNWIHKYLGIKVYHQGHIRSSITGKRFNDLFQLLPKLKFKRANTLLISYGTNDYRHSSDNLITVEKRLGKAVRYIRKENPNIKIYALLPLPRYDDVDMSQVRGAGGYTLSELANGLTHEYKELHIPTYSLQKQHPGFITVKNHDQRYFDHRLHPNPVTYQKIGYYISQWLLTELIKN